MPSKKQRPDGYQIGPDTLVTLRFSVFDAEGELVESSEPEKPFEFVFGYGALLPKLEQALDGLAAGARRSVELPPKDTFGPRDPEAVLEVDRDEFPPDVQPGDHFEAEHESGQLVVLSVLEVLEDAVVIDANHPLAGQRIRYDLEVQGVRPASTAEIAEAERRLMTGAEPPSELIAPQALLRRPSRRYEGDAEGASAETPGPRRG